MASVSAMLSTSTPKNIYATVNIRGLYNECFFANEISFIGE